MSVQSQLAAQAQTDPKIAAIVAQRNANPAPSFQHDVGQIAGHVLNAAPGYSTLGANITNPNVNYQGIANPGTTTATGGATSGAGTVLGASTVKDPYAGTVFGSTAGYNQAVSDYNNLQGTTMNAITSGIGQNADSYNSSILDYLDQEKQQQGKVNNDAIQAELARQSGTAGVLDMVGKGIRSGGVILANDNASNSSAGDAIAKAYGQLGQQQQAGVNGQYATDQNNIQQEQGALDASNTTQARHDDENKTAIVNSIVNDATTKLTALNQAAATASLPDRVNIDQQIASVKAQALSALQNYDQTLSSGIAANAPTTTDANRASAAQLLAAGSAPAANYTADTPAPLAQTGPFSSDLPIFTLPTKAKTAAA